MALDRLVPTSSTPGAVTGDDYMDAVQEEFTGLWNRSVCLLTSIGGTANAITATLAPALTGSVTAGMAFWLTPTNDNTGAATIAINGGSTIPIKDAAGNALTASDLTTGQVYLLISDGTNLRIASSSGGGTVGSGYRVIVKEYLSGATWTKPTGLVKIRVRVRGGGGGSGGKNSDSGSRYGSGGGGGGEAIKEVLAASLSGTETVSVGAGGTAAGSGGTDVGGTGGTSSFGSHCVATGGIGGVTASNSTSTTGFRGGYGGAGTTGDVLLKGQRGRYGGSPAGATGEEGEGGASPTGGAGPDARTTTGNGVSALANSGAGATGGYNTSTSTATGGVGGSGYVIVEEFF